LLVSYSACLSPSSFCLQLVVHEQFYCFGANLRNGVGCRISSAPLFSGDGGTIWGGGDDEVSPICGSVRGRVSLANSTVPPPANMLGSSALRFAGSGEEGARGIACASLPPFSLGIEGGVRASTPPASRLLLSPDEAAEGGGGADGLRGCDGGLAGVCEGW